MNATLRTVLEMVATAGGGLLAAWAMTVPLLRYKEQRPMTPRASDTTAPGGPQVRIAAVVRHARCPACLHDYAPRDLAPFVGWAAKCPNCIRTELPWVASLHVGTALAAALTVLAYPSSWVAVPLLWLVVVGAAVTFTDARIWMIPRRIVWVGGGIGLALVVIVSAVIDRLDRVPWALGGALGAFALFFALWFLAPGRLGFGDVRLIGLLGLFLGWVDVRLVPYGILFGSVAGVLFGLARRLRGQGGHMPFGPALVLGALLALWLHGPLLVG